MIKTRNIQPRSFDHIKNFPGCADNPFDRLLHSLDIIEKVPTTIIFLILVGFALLGTLPRILKTQTIIWSSLFLFLFFISDWILLALLPVTNRSFGPVKVVVVILALMRVPFALLPACWNLGFEITGTLLIIIGFYIEPFRLDVHREVFSSNKLTTGKIVRVLHLGDLHLERITRREEEIINKIHELKPDLILFSGDVLNLSYLNDSKAQLDAIAFFCQLSAPLGVFGVSGSPAVDFQEFFVRLCSQSPLQWLDNKVLTLDTPAGKINLCGLTCTHNPGHDEHVLGDLSQNARLNNDSLNLLLYHSPDLAPNASHFPIDLQLSGHTHGGQIRFPFIGTLFTGSLYGRIFEAGRYLVNDMTLYITRGLGMEGAIAPRVRVNCRPEIILWEIGK